MTAGGALPVVAFIARRAAGLALMLFAAGFAVFAALHLAPGDPATFLLHGRPVNADELARVRTEYHLDRPFLAQFASWATAAVRGDLGTSLQAQLPVGHLIATRLPTTLWLVGYAALLVFAGGTALGVLGACRPGPVDGIVRTLAAVGAATPPFAAAILGVSIFSIGLHWLPAVGAGSGVGSRIQHLTLPALALAVSWTALITQVTRAAVIDELRRDHVAVARGRGVAERHVLVRHVLRNALGPMTTIVALAVAGLFVGTTIVESAFGLNGVGSLLVQAVHNHDFPVVQGVALLIVTVFVVINLVVDLLYPWIDPRVRLGAGAT